VRLKVNAQLASVVLVVRVPRDALRRRKHDREVVIKRVTFDENGNKIRLLMLRVPG
jgi:hypothetical protein